MIDTNILRHYFTITPVHEYMTKYCGDWKSCNHHQVTMYMLVSRNIHTACPSLRTLHLAQAIAITLTYFLFISLQRRYGIHLVPNSNTRPRGKKRDGSQINHHAVFLRKSNQLKIQGPSSLTDYFSHPSLCQIFNMIPFKVAVCHLVFNLLNLQKTECKY